MDAKLIEAYKKTKALHDWLYHLLQDYLPVVQSNTKTMEYLVDLAYACREIDTLLEQAGKDIRKLKRMAETFAVAEHTKDLDAEERIQTDYCSAVPNDDLGLNLPPKGSPEEAGLLEALGIPQGSVGIVRPSYQGIQERIAALETEGRSLPEALSKVQGDYTTYSLSIRAKKAIDADE